MGILSKEQESVIGKKLDGLIDFSKIKGFGVLEVVDGFFFTNVLKFVDDKWGDTLPEQYKEVAGNLVVNLAAEDWESVANGAADLFDVLIDIPLLDEDDESAFVHGIATLALQLISNAAAKK